VLPIRCAMTGLGLRWLQLAEFKVGGIRELFLRFRQEALGSARSFVPADG